MNYKISYKEKYLEEIGYSKSPDRQILMLKISDKAKLFLISFFTHSKDFKISHKQIARMFSNEINLKYVKKYIDELKINKYLIENDNAYYIDLEKIQSDYIECKKIVEQRRKKLNKNAEKYRKPKKATSDGDYLIKKEQTKKVDHTPEKEQRSNKVNGQLPNKVDHTPDKKKLTEGWSAKADVDQYRSKYFSNRHNLNNAYLRFKYFVNEYFSNKTPITIEDFDDSLFILIYLELKSDITNVKSEDINKKLNEVNLNYDLAEGIQNSIYDFHQQKNKYADILNEYQLSKT